MRQRSTTTDQRTIAGTSGAHRRHRTARVLIPLFLAAFMLMTALLRSAYALETASVSSAEDVSIDVSAQPTPNMTEQTPSPSATPLPSITPGQVDEVTPEPTAEATAEPNDETTPEPTAEVTPEPLQAEFSATKDGVTIRLLTAQIEQTADHILTFNRITAQSDADIFARYQTLLEQQIAPDQLGQCAIYELRYTIDGVEVAPPQSETTIKLSDPELLDLLDRNSIKAYYVVGNGSPDSSQIQSVSASVLDGAVSLSLGVCPSAIVICGEALADNIESPYPEESGSTPEPSPEPGAEPTVPQIYAYENEGLYVSGSPASQDVLPEGAVLTAERITSEKYPERYAKFAEMLQQLYGAEFPIAFYAYDISFHAAGQEVEPIGDVVNVTIRDAAFAETVEDPLVYHVVNEESEAPALQEIPAEAATIEGEDQVVFSADSFSVYIVLANGTTLTLADNSGLTYKVIATAADQFTNTSYYNSSRALGIAGNFHIVAFDTASLGAHTNGNVLANKVYANSNFGTNGLTNELSYIQNYMQVNGVSASSNAHVLTLGNANTITAMDNGNAFGVNGTKLDRPKNLWQDQSTASLPFIDLAAVKASTESRSSSLAANSNAYITPHLSTTAGSCTESYILLSNVDKVGFYNITASALSGYNYFGVQGFQSGHNGTVIINVDCTGYSGPLTLPECRMYYGSGAGATAVNFAEVTNFVNGRILWNLVNCTANVTTRLLYATLLAPDASVTLGQNVNGTIIANNVTVNAESHRDDFLGAMSNGETVTGTKVWSDYTTGSPANTSITLQLYRSTDGGATRSAYGTPVTLNSTTGWSYSWTELPTGSLYTIVETMVMKDTTNVTSNYLATYSTQTGVTNGTITVSNQYLYALPETGGAGVLGFYLSGGALLLLATIAGWRRRRAVTDSKL